MKRGNLLVVEDDPDIAEMLRMYFSGQGYDVDVANNGTDALSTTHQNIPNLIILDIILPDMDGFTICQELRSRPRTRHIPIIFLTQKDERSDRLSGLELGADDYITKPFDIEELKLRVQNAIRRAERDHLVDPRTGLPTGQQVKERLSQLLFADHWALLDCRIDHFEGYKDFYSFVAGDEVLAGTASLLQGVLSELGREQDFIGHAGGGNFIIVSEVDIAPDLSQEIKKRFQSKVKDYYSKEDTHRGYMLPPEGTGMTTPLMNMTIGILSSDGITFTDLRELTEAALEARRKDSRVDQQT
ncbi:MAG: response regulator [Anaerolineales bacterium]|nr:MAG: response regulator [Anaerolineales bacterium]